MPDPQTKQVVKGIESESSKIEVPFNYERIATLIPIISLAVVLFSFFNLYSYYALFGVDVSGFIDPSEVIFSFSSIYYLTVLAVPVFTAARFQQYAASQLVLKIINKRQWVTVILRGLASALAAALFALVAYLIKPYVQKG